MLSEEQRGSLARLGAHLSSLLISQLLAAALLLLLNVVLARTLGPSGFGAYVFFISAATVLSIPLSWLLGAIVVFGQEDAAREGSAARSVGAIGALTIVGACVVLLGTWLAAPVIALAVPELTSLLDLLGAYVLVGSLTGAVLGVLQARQQLHTYAALVVLNALVPLVAVLAVGGPTVRAMLLAILGGQILAAAPLAVALARRLPRPVVDRARLRAVASFVVAYVAGSAQGLIVGQADVLVLGLILDAPSLGQYGLAARIYRQLLSLIQILPTVGLPLVNAERIRARDDLIVTYVDRRSPQLVTFVVILTTIATALGLVAIPTIFGAGFVAAAVPFAVLMLSIPPATWRRLVSPVLTAYQLIWEANLAALGSAVVLVVAVLAFAPFMGAAGGAVSVALAAWADLTVALMLVHRRIGGRTEGSSVALLALATALIGAPTVFMVPPLVLIAVTVAAILLFVIAVRRLGVFQPRDLGELAPGDERSHGLVRALVTPFVQGSARR